MPFIKVEPFDIKKCSSNKMFKGYTGCMCNYCWNHRYLHGKWIANVKGEQDTFEISIVRENNRHGIASWGWFDEAKLLISSNVHGLYTSKEIFDDLVKYAKKKAEELNRKEKNAIS